jgi:hypothetical protein
MNGIDRIVMSGVWRFMIHVSSIFRCARMKAWDLVTVCLYLDMKYTV